MTQEEVAGVGQVNKKPDLGALISKLDEESQYVTPDEYGRLQTFQQIIALGETALPHLLQEVPQATDVKWWRVHAVVTIADIIRKPISFADLRKLEEADRNKSVYQLAKDIVVRWGEQQGYSKEPAAD